MISHNYYRAVSQESLNESFNEFKIVLMSGGEVGGWRRGQLLPHPLNKELRKSASFPRKIEDFFLVACMVLLSCHEGKYANWYLHNEAFFFASVVWDQAKEYEAFPYSFNIL